MPKNEQRTCSETAINASTQSARLVTFDAVCGGCMNVDAATWSAGSPVKTFASPYSSQSAVISVRTYSYLREFVGVSRYRCDRWGRVSR
jgi:hypothetical protein